MQTQTNTIQIVRRILLVTGFIFWALFGIQASDQAWSREAVYGTDTQSSQMTGFVTKGL